MSRIDPHASLEDGHGRSPSDAIHGTRDAGLPEEVQVGPDATNSEGMEDAPEEGINWLQLARESYNASTTWAQTNLYRQLERNQSNFRSQHPSGSKYHTAAYKYRSRMFRPKTRTSVRKLEAAVISSLFNNPELISIRPQIEDNPQMAAAAVINQNLVQERLTTTIPWYRICVGASQDAAVNSVVISHQYWKFQLDEEGGVISDKPVVELCPVENLRMDRAADWLDPINSSPYLIHMIPMYIGDVIAKMERTDPKTGQPEWTPLTKDELRSAHREEYDTIRAAREKPMVDPYSSQRSPPIKEFDVVWVHRNFLRIDGKDFVYHTAGTEFMLSEPMYVEEAYPHLRFGERPYVCGTVALEAHRVYPDSYVHLGQGLQSIANDIANRRHDNVLLSMDKRFFIKREANIDREALRRSVPGSGIECEDPNTDVKIVDTGDVTGTAYAEQDRVNQDFDEILGAFSPSTQQANKGARDTQKGLQMAASEQDGQMDYLVRTLLVTWVTPVISQLVRMEQFYETDEMLMAVAADKGEVFQRFGVDQITDELLRHDLTVNVNVGIGATNPERRISVLHQGLSSVAEFPGVAERINADEVIKETFSALGFGDGARFVMPGDQQNPQVAALEQQLQEASQVIETKQIENQTKIEVEKIRQTGFVEQWRTKGTYDMALEAMKQRIDELNMLIKAEEVDLKRAELELERDAMVHSQMAAQLNMKLESAKQNREEAREILKEGGAAAPFRTPPARIPPAAASPPTSGPVGTRKHNAGASAGVRQRQQFGMLTDSPM